MWRNVQSLCHFNSETLDVINALENKVVLITGGAKRVGAVTARRLHQAGARVVLHYRNSDHDAQRLKAELEALRPDSVALVRADLLDIDALPALVDAAIARFGQLDALVNNASSFFATPVGAIDATQWDDLIGTNLKAPLFLAQAAAPYLKKTRGVIVNLTDIHGERPLRGFPVYSIAKAGLIGLTRALAVELAPEIRVNGVSPGPILWPDDNSFDSNERDRIVAHTLLKREGSPDDLARAIFYFIADAPYVTGQILAVDGGRQVNI